MSVAEKIRERRKLITDMLIRAPENRVYGADIRKAIMKSSGKDISKATLSSDIKTLVHEGYEIVSDTEGYRLLNPEFNPSEPETDGFEPVTRDTVARWFIMVILSGGCDRYMSALDIYNEYVNVAAPVSKSKMKRLLDGLVDMKYISRHTINDLIESGESLPEDSGRSSNKLFYHICDSAPVISFIDKEAVMDFNAYYYDGGYAEELGTTLKTINEKIAAVSPDIYEEASGVYKSTGRRNDIPEESAQKLDELLGLPFGKYALDIKYREKEKTKDYIFKTALVIFNVETNAFYLLGEVKAKGKWVRKNLKFSAVKEMSVNVTVSNDIYESRRYRDIFSKMWSAAPDEPCEVEVLFEDRPEIRDMVRSLKKARNETAEVTFIHGNSKPELYAGKQDINEGKKETGKQEGNSPAAGSYLKGSNVTGWIRYSDKIMGTHDFLRVVRSLGDAAVIVKPEKSREHLIARTKEMIEGYREILGYDPKQV